MGVWDGYGLGLCGGVGWIWAYVSVGVWDGYGPRSLWGCGMDVGLGLCGVRLGWVGVAGVNHKSLWSGIGVFRCGV